MRQLPLMIFAAGFGTRMGAMTATRPKPLISVAGRPLIDHALDLAEGVGLPNIVINLHYLGDQIEAHLHRRNVRFSWERSQILETGGGLKAALPLLGEGPVLTMNSDAVWTGKNPLQTVLDAWNPDQMDALLLLLPHENALGHSGTGDFLLNDSGQIQRANGAAAPVYSGVQIIKTSALTAITEPVFSLNRLWDDMMKQRRAYGVMHRGGWCDVGHPLGVAQAEAMLAQGGQDV